MNQEQIRMGERDESPHYESLLWQKAEELSNVRTALDSRRDELFAHINEAKKKGANLHEEEVLMREEAEYWRIEEKLREIQAQEGAVQKLLEDLGSGEVNRGAIEAFIEKPQQEEKGLSKKKQRIREERERLGIDPREAIYDDYVLFGIAPLYATPRFNEFSSSKRLTTGRHQQRIKTAGLSADEAAGEFFYRTTDTHGGKVRPGKKATGYYTAPGGRSVRKK